MNKPNKSTSHMSLGYNLAVSMGALSLIGYWVDLKRQTTPFWTLFGVGLGFVYCIYEIWKFIRSDED